MLDEIEHIDISLNPSQTRFRLSLKIINSVHPSWGLGQVIKGEKMLRDISGSNPCKNIVL